MELVLIYDICIFEMRIPSIQNVEIGDMKNKNSKNGIKKKKRIQEP